MEPVSVLIVAADADARAGLLESLGRHPALNVTVAADDHVTAIDDAAGEAAALPVVIWDVGVDTPRADVVSDVHPSPVIALVATDGDVSDAMAAGVHAILPRDAGPDLIVAAAAAVARGLLVFDRAYAPGVRLARPVHAQVPMEELTSRESEILQLLAEGMSNKAIAQALGISDHTVKFHLNAILGKLDAHTRTEAVTRAARLGLIVL